MSAAGVKPNQRKVNAVSEYPVPTSVKELKQFLGLTNYYRKFIYNYAHTAEPLTKLLRGNLFGTHVVSRHLIPSNPNC